MRWPLNVPETMRVRFDTYQGHNIIDLRRLYAASDGALKPDFGGLTIAIRHLPTLASTLEEAMEDATASGFVASDGPRT